MAAAGMQLTEKDAELVLLPLKLACESKQPKLVETALDCLHVSCSVLCCCFGNWEGTLVAKGARFELC